MLKKGFILSLRYSLGRYNIFRDWLMGVFQLVARAPLKKRWRRDEKTGKTIKLKDFRTFPIRRDELLTRYVEE